MKGKEDFKWVKRRLFGDEPNGEVCLMCYVTRLTVDGETAKKEKELGDWIKKRHGDGNHPIE